MSERFGGFSKKAKDSFDELGIETGEKYPKLFEKNKINKNKIQIETKNQLDREKLKTSQENRLKNKDEYKYSTSHILDKFNTVFEIDKYTGLSSNNLEIFGLDIDTNTKQEEIIAKILGSDKGFNDTELQGFSDKKGGNYLIKIVDFENKIKDTTDIKTINSKVLASYFKYLNNKKINIIDLHKNLGPNLLVQLGKLWNTESNDENRQIAKEILRESQWGKDVINYIKIYNGSTTAIDIVNIMPENQKQIAIIDLKNNIEKLKDRFEIDLYNELSKNNNKSPDEINKLVKQIIYDLLNVQNNKGFEGIKTMADICTKYGIQNIDRNIKLANEMKEKNITVQVIELDRAIIMGKEKGVDISTLEEKRNKLVYSLKNIQKNTLVINKLTNSDYKKIAKGEIIFDEYINKLIANDKDLKKELEELDEKKDKAETENNEGTEENEYIGYYSSYFEESDFTYNNELGMVYIEGENKPIFLQEKEREIIKNNPETLENIVDFNKTLRLIGLGSLWDIREQIFTGIKNSVGVGFNIDKNYLNPNELKIFLNAILKSVGEEEISPIFDIDSYLAKFKEKNNIQLGGGIKEENLEGDSKIEKKFIEKYCPRGNIIGFNVGEFEKGLI